MPALRPSSRIAESSQVACGAAGAGGGVAAGAGVTAGPQEASRPGSGAHRIHVQLWLAFIGPHRVRRLLPVNMPRRQHSRTVDSGRPA